MTDLDRLLKKLRTPEAATLLAERFTRDLLARPVGELVPTRPAAEAVHEILQAWVQSEKGEALLLERLEVGLGKADAIAKPLGQALPEALAGAVRHLSQRPYSPDRKLVLLMIDREPMRKLIRTLLVEALVEFGRKLAAPIAGTKVGKSLGTLGAIAGAVGAVAVGAVGGELEKQVERRAADFADAGLSRILQRLVSLASDPSQAAEQAELRAAVVEGALEVPVRDWARELRRSDLGAQAKVVRAALKSWLARPESLGEIESALAEALAPDAQRPLGELLDLLGLRAEVEKHLRQALADRSQAFDWAGYFGELLGGARS